MSRVFTILLICSSILACSDSKVTLPVLELSAQDFRFEVHADGELEAVNATPITTPPGGRGPQTLSWITDGFSTVKKGEIVARFDGSDFQLKADDADYEIQKLGLAIAGKQRELGLSLQGLTNESGIVGLEMDMAEKFNIDDPMLYSQMEIIDSMSDEEFLEAKTDYLDKMGIHYETKSDAEMSVLETQQSSHDAKLKFNERGLSMLEVAAPHDGMFVLQKNWYGNLPRAGQAVYPGTKLALLPDLSQMQASLYVPEVEANGIREGQPATVRLHAYPDRELTGKVSHISKSAQPRQRDNPVKYFTVKVVLDQADPEWLIPGQRLDAAIVVADHSDVISVPAQATFRDEDVSWVYVQQDGGFVRRSIETELCSTSRCLVRSGLEAGEAIALAEPEVEQDDKGADSS